MTYFLIFLGGGIGSTARFAISFFGNKPDGGFPFGTLAVNLAGAFIAGILVHFLAIKFPTAQNLRYFLMTGFLGGFTTFSAFSVESAAMLARGDYAMVAIYVAVSVLGGIALAIIPSILFF